MDQNKKGDWKYSTIAILIIVIVCGVILMWSTGIFAKEAGRAGDKSACQTWVDARAAKILGKQLVGGGGCPCITETIEVETKNEDEVYEILAKEMYDCWDMYRRGKKDFYSDWDWGVGDTHCRICDEILFDSKTKINMNGFEGYLDTHSPPLHKESYSDFFLGTEGGKIDFGEGEFNLDKNEPLYTLFVIKKSSGDLGAVLKDTSKRTLKTGAIVYGLGALGCTVATAATAGIAAVPCFGFLITKGAITASLVGVIGSNVIYSSATKSYHQPSLFLIQGEDLKSKACDDIYINKKETQPFDKFGGWESDGVSGDTNDE